MKRDYEKPVKSSSQNTRKTKRYSTRGTAERYGSNEKPWYELPSGDVHERIFQRVRSLKSQQVRRRYQLAVYQQMYNNNLSSIWAPSSMFSATAANVMGAFNRLSTNVVKSCIDTATAMIAKSKPRAFVLPTKGDYRLKRKARNLTKFLDGSMKASGFYAESEDVFRDACMYDGGAILIRPDHGNVRSTALKADEVIIDPVDGMYNDPQEITWEHPTPRTELLEDHGRDFAEEIEAARMTWRGDMAFMSERDLVLVTHTWRRPSTPAAKDGRYVKCINGATLVDQPWDKPYLPVLRFHWTPPTYGPFGGGITQDLEGKQWMISNVMRDIAESVHKFAVPRVWLDTASGVSQHSITNDLSVNLYTGQPPIFSTPAAMAADVYQFLQWLIDDCFKELGLSQLQAQSEKPAGLDSGVALRTYQDVQTQRFALVGQRWERFYMRAAELHIDAAADIYAEKNKLSVKVEGRGFVETVDWKDASLSKDLYDIAVWPTNILPETPEGKLQTVQDFTNSGFMPRDVAISQLRMPILTDWIDQETAARDNVELCLSSILDKGKYIAPDPISNVQLCIQLAQSAYLRAIDEDVDEKRVEMLLRFLNRALELDAQAKAQAMAAAMPPPSPSGAGPAGPPGAKGPAVGQAAALPPAPLAPAGAGAVPMPSAAA